MLSKYRFTSIIVFFYKEQRCFYSASFSELCSCMLFLVFKWFVCAKMLSTWPLNVFWRLEATQAECHPVSLHYSLREDGHLCCRYPQTHKTAHTKTINTYKKKAPRARGKIFVFHFRVNCPFSALPCSDVNPKVLWGACDVSLPGY